MSGIELKIDGGELAWLRRDLEALPEKIQRQVIGRAYGRTRKKLASEYVKLASDRENIFQKAIRQRLSVRSSAAGLILSVYSDQIPLSKLGTQAVKPTKKDGMRIFGPRGQKGVKNDGYRHAFLATMASGHSGVFVRKPGTRMATKKKEQIRELYGPNPAGEMIRNPDEYRMMLEEIAMTTMLREIKSGVAGLLKSLGKATNS